MSKIKEIFDGLEELDEKSVDFLIRAIEQNNLPGFDYLEFKQSLKALREMDMPEETAVKSAYATATTVGLTKTKLINTAEHYKKVLLKEKAQFDAALQKQMAQRVEGKESAKKKLADTIDEYKERITQLQDEIEKLQEKHDKADSEIEKALGRIEETKEKFERSIKSMMSQIDDDVRLVNTIL